MPRPFGWTVADPRWGYKRWGTYGLGQFDPTVLPAPNAGAAYFDPAGNIIIPGQTGGWSVLGSNGQMIPGSGAAPLFNGSLSTGEIAQYSPLPQSSSGSFAQGTLAAINPLSNYTGLLGMVAIGLLGLLVIKKL